MYFKPGFVIGPLVIKNPKALGISYHELGHKLYSYFKFTNKCVDDKIWFDKVRKCILDSHTELSESQMIEQKKLILSGLPSAYEQEDWADLISSLIDGKDENFACMFARQLNDRDYNSLSLKNPVDGDPHSSDLFRTLNLSVQKKAKLPDVCNVALSVREEKTNFKNCLVKATNP